MNIPSREFVCSECGRKVTRDSYTYFGQIQAPDEDKKCPTCGHVPLGWFVYCSPECFAKAHPNHPFVKCREREKEIERIMSSEGVDRETADHLDWERRGFVQVGETAWKKPLEKAKFHKEFPKLAKELGFRVYKQGFPDFLIERNGRYVAVEIKERSMLEPRQRLMHEALKSAGLKVITVTPDTDLNKVFSETLGSP
jgi:DNA-directed RNA polymerase subunit RPC12/RpoP